MTRLQVHHNDHSIKGILFDKDGTLVDFIHTWGYWVELMLDHFSKGLIAQKLAPLDDRIYSALGVVGNRQLGIQDYDRQGPLSVGTLHDLLAILSFQGYERGMTWAKARLLAGESQRRASSTIESERRIQALPGCIEFLQLCEQHQLKLAVVTADDTKPVQQQLTWLGLETVFHTVVGNDHVANGKPFPDMVQLACQRLELSPHEVAVIGDTNGDMMMAKAAGAQLAIAYLSDPSLSLNDYPDADICIYHYSDMKLLTSML